MKSRVEIKRTAREGMRERYKLSIGTLLLYGVVSLVLVIPYVGFVLGLLILPVLYVGLLCVYLGVYRKQQTEAGAMFSGFSRYGRVLGGSLWMALWLFLWGLIFIVAFAVLVTNVMITVMLTTDAGGDAAASVMRHALPFLCLLLIPMIIRAHAYFCTPYILADSPAVFATNALTLSKKIMRGNKAKLFAFRLSFLPWYLLMAGVVVATAVPDIPAGAVAQGGAFGYMAYAAGSPYGWLRIVGVVAAYALGVFYVGPYMATADAGFYDEVKRDALARGVVTEADFCPPQVWYPPQTPPQPPPENKDENKE